MCAHRFRRFSARDADRIRTVVLIFEIVSTPCSTIYWIHLRNSDLFFGCDHNSRNLSRSRSQNSIPLTGNTSIQLSFVGQYNPTHIRVHRFSKTHGQSTNESSHLPKNSKHLLTNNFVILIGCCSTMELGSCSAVFSLSSRPGQIRQFITTPVDNAKS
jgi:hypothetical protein